MNGVCRVDISPSMSAGLRKLASSAAAACNSMTSVQSADTLTYIMTSVISAHYDTCLYTSDKVVVGKFKYDTFMCNKPPVSIFTSLYFALCQNMANFFKRIILYNSGSKLQCVFCGRSRFRLSPLRQTT